MIFSHFFMLAIVSIGGASNLKALSKRQGSGAFIPGTNTVTACAPNEVECNDYCLDLAAGDVCCSEGYGCPGGSFCLTNGYCCPNELDPNTCALNNGVSLTAGFNTNPVPPTPAATATGSPSGTVPTIGTPAATYSISTGKVTATTTQTTEPFLGGSGKADSMAGAVVAAVAGFLGIIL
jgi:hypothetical protein